MTALPGWAPTAATGGTPYAGGGSYRYGVLEHRWSASGARGAGAFEIQTPIAIGAWIVLSLWLVLINRWLRLSSALQPQVTQLGEFLGAGTLAGYVIVGIGLLLPWMSWVQLVVFGFEWDALEVRE